MKKLNEPEEQLIKLAVLEGLQEIMDKLNIDFKIKESDLTVHQEYRLQDLTELLYTLLCDVVEDFGVLQSEYDR
jgi:hypothetical protein